MTDTGESTPAPDPDAGPDATASTEPIASTEPVSDGPVSDEAPAGAPPSKTPRWRRIVAVVLLVVGFILVPLSAVAIWSRNQLLNTDRYVNTVSPLAGNAAIQSAVSTAAVRALFDQVNADDTIQNALPKRAKFLGPTLTTELEAYATKLANKLVASDQFQTLWDGANRRAHTQLVALLTNDKNKPDGALAIKNGQVSLDISQVITKVQAKLVDAGLTFLSNVKVPPVQASVKIIDSKGLSSARSYASLLNTLAWVLPFVALACLIASALIVRTRRRATIRAALVLVAACAFTLIVLAVARSVYLDAVKDANKDAAAAIFDILLRNLRYGVIVLGVIGLLVAVVAYFVGPSAPAVRARGLATAGIGGLRGRAEEHGYEGGPVSRFAGAHRHGLEIAIVGVLVIVFLIWSRPTIGAIVFLAVIGLILVGVVEFLARDTERAPAEESEKS